MQKMKYRNMGTSIWHRSSYATHVNRNVVDSYAAALVPVIIFVSIAISIALSGREVSLYGIVTGKLTKSPMVETAVLQLGTASLVGLTLLIICRLIISESIPNAASRLKIFFTFVAFWLTQKITAGFSLGSDFKYQYLYVLIIIFGAVWFRSEKSERPLRLLKSSLLTVNVAGFIFLIIAPDVVRQNEYFNAIYFSYRYWGLTSHANNLGPQLVLLGLLTIFFPYKNRVFQLISYVVILVGLMLSQSKTAIISCAVAFVLYRYIFYKSDTNLNKKKFKLNVLFLAIFLVNAGFIFFIKNNIVVNQFITGRGNIWAISMVEFLSNPWFGGGGRVWSDGFAENFGYLGVASNAHNQIVDVLSLSGIFGGLALITFLMRLIYVVNLENKLGKAFAFLILFSILRGFSEVPFRLGVPMSNDFAILITLVMFAVASLSRQQMSNSMPPKNV